METGRGTGWGKRIGLAAIVLVVAGGVYIGTNWSALSARRAAAHLQAATSDEGRQAAAETLIALGDAGVPALLAPFHADDATTCAAIVGAIQHSLDSSPPGDPRFSGLLRPFLDGFGTFSETGQQATLELVPWLLACPQPDAVPRCREIVRAGLKSSSPAGRVQAIRLAFRPSLAITADIVPLLNDADPEVRRAALLTVGPTTGDAHPVLADEELFPFLNDPDREMRSLAGSALTTRGLSAEQVQLARQLTHPDPAERLKLLVDLRFAGDAVTDAGPWLERLSRDPEPAVRIGAARVAIESKLVFVGWLATLEHGDPDPTVRRWAGYYRLQGNAVRPTSWETRGP